MADATKDAAATTGAAEPSMEEILASIRKIISDDNDPAMANGAAAGADVLELTQMVQEDGSVVDMKPSASLDPLMPPPAPEKPKAGSTASPASNLVSPPAASAAAAALSSLASTVEIERLASAPPMTATFIGNGARTLEDMAMELMKPLLKEWLDKNLPPIVDRLVQKEIERISKKAQE